MVQVSGEGDLLYVICTLHLSSGFSSRLHGGQQQGDEHTDNRDDDEEFDESKSSSGNVFAAPSYFAPLV